MAESDAQPGFAHRLLVSTIAASLRNRVTGLAAEAAFFAVLSLPPLIFALAGSVGYVFANISHQQVDEARRAVLGLAGQALTPETVHNIVAPTLDDVLRGGRYDVISVGFVLALWSGSRALHVFVDTITLMYGLSGQRGIVRTRMLSFALYVFGLVTGVVFLPLILAGPSLMSRLVTGRLAFLNGLYWPVVIAGAICFLATLYHVSVPVRTRWPSNLPGAVFTLLCWVFGSALLRWVLVGTAEQSTSIYGPLAAPIAVLLWMYLLSLSVLIGAAINASWEFLRAEMGEREGAWRRTLRRVNVSALASVPLTRGPRGCVLSIDTGVAVLLTDGGEVRASLGSRLLAAVARDRTAMPEPGDWVSLRRWPDGRVTIEQTLRRPPRAASATVLRFRTR